MLNCIFNQLYYHALIVLLWIIFSFYIVPGASQMVLVIKNPPTDAGDIRDVGSIPGSDSLPSEPPDN